MCVDDFSKELFAHVLVWQRPLFVSRWFLRLSLPGEKGTALLSVVQIGSVKHIPHLSLKMVSASDTSLKKHLAECLLRLKVSGLLSGPLFVSGWSGSDSPL